MGFVPDSARLDRVLILEKVIRKASETIGVSGAFSVRSAACEKDTVKKQLHILVICLILIVKLRQISAVFIPEIAEILLGGVLI